MTEWTNTWQDGHMEQNTQTMTKFNPELLFNLFNLKPTFQQLDKVVGEAAGQSQKTQVNWECLVKEPVCRVFLWKSSLSILADVGDTESESTMLHPLSKWSEGHRCLSKQQPEKLLLDSLGKDGLQALDTGLSGFHLASRKFWQSIRWFRKVKRLE